MIKLSDYVIDFIARQGVGHVFMLPGGGAMHLNDSLGRNRVVDYICNLHEQACAIGADAYAQYTNNLGVAMVTTGPGGTNAVTGVAASWLESTPVLVVSGQVKRPDRIGQRGVRQMGFQEIDIVGVVRPITKYAATVEEPETIRYHLEKAVHLARGGRRGPVWIDIPLDVQAARIDEANLPVFSPAEIPGRNDAEGLKGEVALAIELLNASARPVILAGNGVRLSGAIRELLSLIRELEIPVLTTWKAADFLGEEHPLFAGRPGAVGQRGANFTQQNADCILILGARLDLGLTAYNHENFAPGARKIMVDIDPAEIRKMQTKIDVPVNSDAGEFLREFKRQRPRIQKQDRSGWLSRCKEWQRRYPVTLPEYWEEQGFVNDYVLMDVLSDELESGDLLVPGSSGACSERTMQAVRVKEGLRIFNSQGLGPMGFGIPAAIGGCVAGGKRRTVCIDGDGGFIMNIQELETVRRLSLPIKFFVLNNGGYGSIRMTQKNYFGGHYVASTRESGLTLPDLAAVSRAFGIPAAKIANHSRIRAQVREILCAEGPVLCDVSVSPDQATAPRVSSRQTEDGRFVSMPMEDLWPFLDRQEFTRNLVR